tara:strand:+ start:849 stop:1025 length:177 start_codon:yes stop_codon:yes gene_type:complete
MEIIGIILVVVYLMFARGTLDDQIEALRLGNNRNVREIDELKEEIEKLQKQIDSLEWG